MSAGSQLVHARNCLVGLLPYLAHAVGCRGDAKCTCGMERARLIATRAANTKTGRTRLVSRVEAAERAAEFDARAVREDETRRAGAPPQPDVSRGGLAFVGGRLLDLDAFYR